MRFENRPKEPYRQVLRNNARALRTNLSLAERLLWSRIKGTSLGVRFRRQHRIGNYIADFYCAERQLVVELDGLSHEHEKQSFKDELRDEYLTSRGLRVLRFSNQQIYQNLEGVRRTIARECGVNCEGKEPSPLPPSQSTGRGS